MRNKIFKGFFWKFSEQISSQLATFIISIILARLLSPKDYGTVALVNVFIIIANVFVTSGLGTALIQKKNATELDFSTIFYCSLIMSIIAYIAIFLISPYVAQFYNDEILTNILRVFALQLPLSAFNAIQQAYISRKMMFQKIFISTTISTLVSGIVGIIMAYTGFGAWSIIGQYLSNTIMTTIMLHFQIPWRPKLEFSWTSGKPLIRYGWKILVTDLIGQIFNQLRPLLLGKVYTTSDLAYYNRGQKFPELISNNIDGTVSSVLFPAMSTYGNDIVKVKLMVRQALKVSTFTLMPLMFGMAATSKEIIVLLLTNKWISAVPFMQFLCIASAFSSVSNVNMQAIKAIGRSDIVLKLEFIKKPMYLILLFIGMKISVMAVAYTMTIYSIYAGYANMSPNRKLLNYSFKEQLEDIIPALLASCSMFVVVWLLGRFLRLPMFLIFVVKVIAGVIYYLGIAYLFKMQALSFMVGTVKNRVNK